MALADKIPQTGRPAGRTVYLINEVNLAVRTRMEVALRDHNLTVAQYSVMSLLVYPPRAASNSEGRDGISSAKIARARRVSPQTINELIVGLEGRGLVARLGDPDNRRELLVSLTKSGRDKLRLCDVAIDAVERDLFADLDTATHTALRDILSAVVARIRRTES